MTEEKEKAKEIQKCYICLELPVDPIYPGGCTHALCKSHLKVHKIKINLIKLYLGSF